MLSTNEDGLKNYTNSMFYVKYDQGTHFSGMNYPYGEHLIFTDGQPLFSWILKYVENTIRPISDNVPGLFNVAMFASFVLCMWLVFLICRHYMLPSWYAVCVSVLIGAMSPQLNRITGHYSLAYAWIVPLTWWILIQCKAGSIKAWWVALIGVVFLFTVGMIHVYHLMIGSVFAMAYFFVRAVAYRKDRRILWQTLGIGALFSFSPALLFKVFLVLTDPVKDRPTNPYGFFDYLSYWKTIFVPSDGPVRALWNMFIDFRYVDAEGVAYVGLIALVVCIATLYRWVGRITHGQPLRIVSPALPKELSIFFWAGVLVLLFSFGYPFSLGLEFLLDLVQPLRQFRGLGRFSWVFYYIITVYASVYLYLLYRTLLAKRLKALGISLLVLALVVWFTETMVHIKVRYDYIKTWEHQNILRKPAYNYTAWLSELGYSATDFQAIVPVPAFFIGSEKFYSYKVDYFASREGISAAYQTGLPLTCGLLSRTSLSQTLRLVQLFSNDYIDKEVVRDYPNTKPLLVLAVEGARMHPNETAFLQKGIKLGTLQNLSLYKLSLDSLSTRKQPVIEKYKRLIQDSTLLEGNAIMTGNKWRYYDALGKEKNTYLGASIRTEKQGPISIFEGQIPDTGQYRISVWVKANLMHDGFPALYLKEFGANGAFIRQYEATPKYEFDVYKDFVLAQTTFRVSDTTIRYQAVMEGRYIEMSSLLIQPQKSEFFLTLNERGDFMYNNYYFEKN